MKSRKSLLASGILDSIKKFFESAEFAGRPDKIHEYILWALRPGGLAYYGIPTPQECRVKSDNPNYIVCLTHRDLHRFSNLRGFAGTGPTGTGMGQQIDTCNPSPTHH